MAVASSNPDNLAMALRDLAESRLSELKINPFEAARRGGLERYFVYDIVAGRKLTVLGKSVDKLASALAVEPEAVIAAMASPAGQLPPVRKISRTSEIKPADVPAPDPAAMERDIPVFAAGTAPNVGKAKAFSIDTSRPVDQVGRPRGLAGAPDAYAFFVVDDSLVPMHSPGELCFAHPHRPARAGDTVLVTLKEAGNPVLMKVLEASSPERLVLSQLKPKGTIELKPAAVASMHKVLSVNELFGL